jgi:DNA-binding NtrC family response regulator
MTRVLIVDDEFLIRWALARTLESHGGTVVEAEDARTARRAIVEAAQPFDVVLLDYRLPDNSDFALLSAVRRLSPRSRVVMMSAHMDADDAAAACEAGASAVLAKPLDLDAVCTLVLGT